jgi:UDP-glucose 4-epimerase
VSQEWERTFEDKQVMITGGAGFIGSNLAHRLVNLGTRVLIVDSFIPEYGGNLFNLAGMEDFVRLNVADMRDVHGMKYLVRDCDYIFNFAGQVSHLDSVHDPCTDLEINCRAQISLLESCRGLARKPKIVFASTRQIYGRPQYLPVDELHPLNPTDPNGINKIAGESYHLLYSRLYEIPCCSLRLTNTYGPRMRVCDARQTFIGWWFRQLIEGKEICVFGDGCQLRDFNYVDDVIDAALMAAADPKSSGETYNLGSEPISLTELAELMIAVNGGGSFRLVPFPETRKAIDIGDYQGDTRKIRSSLGWVPKTGLREGLRRTLEYYREFGEHYWSREPHAVPVAVASR